MTLLLFCFAAPMLVAAFFYFNSQFDLGRARSVFRQRFHALKTTLETELALEREAHKVVLEVAERSARHLEDERCGNIALSQQAMTLRAEKEAVEAQKLEIERRFEFLRGQFKRVDLKLFESLRDLEPEHQGALRELLSDPARSPAQHVQMVRHAANVDARLRTLKALWSDGSSCSEAEATQALCENLWVLEPGLRSARHIFYDRGLKNIVDGYFPDQRIEGSRYKFLDTARRADVAGIFYRRSQVSANKPEGERVFVVIEAKSHAVTIDSRIMDEALHYAWNLRKLVPALADWDFECFAIGGRIAPDTHAQQVGFGSKQRKITVTPMSWRGLYERAIAIIPTPALLAPVLINTDPPSHLVFAAGNAAEDEEGHSEAFDQPSNTIPFPRLDSGLDRRAAE